MRILMRTTRAGRSAYPVRMGDLADTTAAAALEQPPAPRESDQPSRILVIEDEPGIVDFVRRGLEAAGFEVEAALDGVSGERLALKERFDAVVLDLMLPRRSGLAVLAAVRLALPQLPVIVLTARGEIEDRVEGLDSGAVDYIVKPFAMAELVARVRAHMRVVAQASTSVLSAEGIEIDLITRRVRRDGRDPALDDRVRVARLSHASARRGGLA